MGTLLLLITLICEIAFAIYCVITKQNHKKNEELDEDCCIYSLCTTHTFIGDCVEFPLANAYNSTFHFGSTGNDFSYP